MLDPRPLAYVHHGWATCSGIQGLVPLFEYLSGNWGPLVRGATSHTASASIFRSCNSDSRSDMVLRNRHWSVTGDNAHQVTPVAINLSSWPSPKKSQLPSSSIGCDPNMLFGRTSIGFVMLSPKPQLPF